MSHATVSCCLSRRGLSRAPKSSREAVRRLSGPVPAICCRWTSSALHASAAQGIVSLAIDIAQAKEKRARVGWEFAHSMIGDHSRLVYTELLDDEQAPTVTGFVQRALSFYASHDISAERLQTDNDNHFSYAKNRSLRELLAREGIHHRFIPLRTPKRNGKVERYQQTLAREWAYGQRYRSSDALAAAPSPHWLCTTTPPGTVSV